MWQYKKSLRGHCVKLWIAAGFMVEIPRCWKFKRYEISDRDSLHNKKQSKKEMKAVGRNAGGLK